MQYASWTAVIAGSRAQSSSWVLNRFPLQASVPETKAETKAGPLTATQLEFKVRYKLASVATHSCPSITTRRSLFPAQWSRLPGAAKKVSCGNRLNIACLTEKGTIQMVRCVVSYGGATCFDCVA
jgi:hypothetical protein